MKKTNAEILEFTLAAQKYLSLFDRLEKKTPAHIRLKYALQRVIKKTIPICDEVKEQKDSAGLSMCFLDSDGCVVYNENGGYKYSRENTNKVRSAIKEIDQKRQDVDPHYVTERIADFPFSSTILEGFVYKTLTEAEEIKILESQEKKPNS